MCRCERAVKAASVCCGADVWVDWGMQTAHDDPVLCSGHAPEGVVGGLVRLLVVLHALHQVQALEVRELSHVYVCVVVEGEGEGECGCVDVRETGCVLVSQSLPLCLCSSHTSRMQMCAPACGCA